MKAQRQQWGARQNTSIEGLAKEKETEVCALKWSIVLSRICHSRICIERSADIVTFLPISFRRTSDTRARLINTLIPLTWVCRRTDLGSSNFLYYLLPRKILDSRISSYLGIISEVLGRGKLVRLAWSLKGIMIGSSTLRNINFQVIAYVSLLIN